MIPVLDCHDIRMLHSIARGITEQGDQPMAVYKPGSSKFSSSVIERLLDLRLLDWTSEQHKTWGCVRITELGWAALAKYPEPGIREVEEGTNKKPAG